MTNTRTDPLWGLPDPDTAPEYYDGVAIKRGLAWVIDVMITLAITVIAIPFTAFTALLFLPALWLVVSFTYRTLTIASRSATWGMRFAGVELRNHRGERFSLPEAAVHTVLHILCMSFVLPQVVSAVLMLTSARGQGLPDMALGTAGLNRSR